MSIVLGYFELDLNGQDGIGATGRLWKRPSWAFAEFLAAIVIKAAPYICSIFADSLLQSNWAVWSVPWMTHRASTHRY